MLLCTSGVMTSSVDSDARSFAPRREHTTEEKKQMVGARSEMGLSLNLHSPATTC